jgi:predicted signal transduction protein with EAL and GGDEF domain
LLHRADTALYQAKQAGRDRFRVAVAASARTEPGDAARACP